MRVKTKRYPNIEAERARAGYSVSEISELLGISRKTYYNWRLKGCIPQKYLEKLADLFNTTTDYLLTECT